MKRCTVEHEVAAFGTIPVGSLWEDDSPFLSDDTAGYFVEVAPEPEPEPVKPAPIRRSNLKKVNL